MRPGEAAGLIALGGVALILVAAGFLLGLWVGVQVP